MTWDPRKDFKQDFLATNWLSKFLYNLLDLLFVIHWFMYPVHLITHWGLFLSLFCISRTNIILVLFLYYLFLLICVHYMSMGIFYKIKCRPLYVLVPFLQTSEWMHFNLKEHCRHSVQPHRHYVFVLDTRCHSVAMLVAADGNAVGLLKTVH